MRCLIHVSLLLGGLVFLGCGSQDRTQTASKSPSGKAPGSSAQGAQNRGGTRPASSSRNATVTPGKSNLPKPRGKSGSTTSSRPAGFPDPTGGKVPASNGAGFWGEAGKADVSTTIALPPAVDERLIAEAGLRKIESKHLTLYTDVASSPAVDGLGEVFDAAYPHWCKYFGVAEEMPENATMKVWHCRAYLMQDKQKFLTTGLLPESLEAIPNGYSKNYEFWFFDQPTDYYRRHLMLHEGTHSFMHTRLPGTSPVWYTEGIAELLGTHRWDAQGEVKLAYFPADNSEVPDWGRIKLIREACQRNQGLYFDQALQLENAVPSGLGGFYTNQAYAWAWAMSAFMDGHPRYQQRFREKVPKLMVEPNFAIDLKTLFAADWDDLEEEWQLFAANLDYGYDLQRNAVKFQVGEPVGEEPRTVTIDADRGWQSSGIEMLIGSTYEIKAAGRYELGQDPVPWVCEPGGVTIRYYNGMPLGMLVGAVHVDTRGMQTTSPLLRPGKVGLGTTVTPEITGTLYLKVNDAPADLANNRGTLEVTVRRISPDISK